MPRPTSTHLRVARARARSLQMLKRPTRAPSGSWRRWRAHRLRLRSVRLRHGRGNLIPYTVTLSACKHQTTYIVFMRIGEPARRHGLADEDMQHAVRNALRRTDMDEGLTMFIGPARDGTLLEIGVLDFEGDDPVILHAMRLRSKFYPLLGKHRRKR